MKKRYLYAVTALMLAFVLLAGCGKVQNTVLVSASYPEMAQYPDESEYIDKETGI